MPIKRNPNKPPTDLSSFNLLFGGPKKIGKSSLVAQFPDSHIFECEPGNAVHIPGCDYTDIGSIKELDEHLKEADGTDWVKTWIWDQVDAPYKWFLDKICRDEGVLDPKDIGAYGKGWGAINREYHFRVNKFLTLKGGHIFTVHAAQHTITTITKQEITKYQPILKKSVREDFVNPKIHNIWMMDYINNERVLIIQGDDYYEASTANLEQHFRTPSGQSIKHIPLGRSPQEGYENILACFRNEMELEEEYLVTSLPVKEPLKTNGLKKLKPLKKL